MERHVKERLVGAAVLMAAAIILIPEMLSGPDRATRAPAQRPSREGSLKTYTIDLQQSREGATTVQRVEERAPPPEQIASEVAPAPQESPPTAQANPERVRAVEAGVQEEAAPAATAPQSAASARERVDETPTSNARVGSSNDDASPRTAAQPSASSTSGRWAVQLGSFSKQATADRLAGELRANGHRAFVMPVRAGGNSLYRVRVGPMQDRASAEAALRALQGKAPGAAVVPHP